MTLRHLPASARVATSWRNGGGITREVAIEPSGSGFRWRISIAEVASDGPFSAFRGCDRIITLLRGAGMALTVDGLTRIIDRPYEPFDFSGDAVTDCRLVDGPVVDINLIHASDQPAELEIIRPSGRVALGPIARAVVVVLAQPAMVRTTDHRAALDVFDAVDIVDEPEVEIDGGVLAMIRIGAPRNSAILPLGPPR